MAKEFDDDIEAMSLNWGEKSGLQMYRNYTKAFDNSAEQRFAKEVDDEGFDGMRLTKVCAILAYEDARFFCLWLFAASPTRYFWQRSRLPCRRKSPAE